MAFIADRFYDAGLQYEVYSPDMTTEDFIKLAYQNVLGRNLDAEPEAAKTEALTFWGPRLDNKEISQGQFILRLIDAAKAYAGDADWGWVPKYLEARQQAGELFVNSDLGKISDPAQAIEKGQAVLSGITADTFKENPDANPTSVAQQAFNDWQAEELGQTFMLTTGVDNIAGTAGNDTINAVQTSTSGSVFGGLDVVDGAGGNDTLNVQDTATAANAAFSFNGATIKNVETLALTTSGYLKDLDLSGFTGLKTVSLLANSTHGTADNTGLKLGSIDTVAVTAQAGNVSIASGGKAINITAAGAATIDVGATGAGNQNTSATSLTLKTGSGTVKAYGSALTDVTVLGGGTVTIQNSDSSGSNNNGTTLKSVTLKNDADATVGGKAIETLTLSGQGAGGTARTITVNNATTNHSLTVNVDGTGYKTDGIEAQTVVVDAAANPITETTSPNPTNDYAVSKLAMEQMARLWQPQLPILIARPFNTTGVGQPTHYLIPKLVAHFQMRAPEIELGNLDVWRDYSDVRAVVAAYRRLIEHPAVGATVNICSGTTHSVREILALLERLTGHTLTVRTNPALIRANEVTHLCGSNALLKELIGPWRTPPLEETLAWMLQHPLHTQL